MRAIILRAMQELEFKTGLKQVSNYTKEEKQMLLDALDNCAHEFKWMTDDKLEFILRNGMRSKYGDFYHLNEKTFMGWIHAYYRDNMQTINQTILKKEDEVEVSEEEKQYWIEVGRQNFRDKFNTSKEGSVPDLALWGPYFYDKFIENGLLLENDFNVSPEEIKKELRISRPYSDESTVMAIRKNRIWRLFVKEMINRKMDLTQYI